MNSFMFLYAFVLFFALTPGVLVTLPPKSKKLIVAATHGVVFALIWTLTHKFVWKLTHGVFEGYDGNKDKKGEKEEKDKKGDHMKHEDESNDEPKENMKKNKASKEMPDSDAPGPANA